jgi:cytochrome c oxidase accessory protein FixG
MSVAVKETENLYEFEEEFRDTIATVDESGKRVWIYPKKPKGRYHNARIWVTVVLLGLFFSGPFIKIAGQPLLMFNIFERKFVILGNVFWPQDFFIFALAAITFFVFVIMFTVAFGRLWCGWACPQTIFMEMVFRKIEYWIEGDANKQRKLDAMPWNAEKIRKKGLKHLIFISISVLISHTAMAYLVGIEKVQELVTSPPTENIAGFLGLVAFTGVFYWVFSYFREQACIAVCPYGRLQGVLLVKDSLVVAYDWLRGEPRGKIKKGQDNSHLGDCIDCKLCVHACPTGIDIRNGTQLECVNCTACIDACDEVMDKVNKPRGLIRFSSYNAIKEGRSKIFHPRVAAYSVVLVALLSLLTFFVVTRKDIETTVLRVPGMLYQKTDDGQISNLYNVQLVNKTQKPMKIELKLADVSQGSLSFVGSEDVVVEASGLFDGVFFIKRPPEKIEGVRSKVELQVYGNGELIDDITTRFIAPGSVN